MSRPNLKCAGQARHLNLWSCLEQRMWLVRREAAAQEIFCSSDVTSAAFVSSFIPRVSTRVQSERSNPRVCQTWERPEVVRGKRERERADEASSRQLPPLELPPNRHWPLHESVQGSQHLPQGDRGRPQQDRHPRLELPKGEHHQLTEGHPPSALNSDDCKLSKMAWAGWRLGAMTGQHMSHILSCSCHLFKPRRQVLKGQEFLDMASALSQTRMFCDSTLN